jgi:hypothetical protein
MSSRITERPEQIDGVTSRTICGAVGERLRRDFAPDVSDLPPSLRGLLEAMRRQEAALTDDRNLA